MLATQQVIAVFLRGANAPGLQIKRAGTGSPVSPLRIGITEHEVIGILGENREIAPLDNPEVIYNFYPEVGVAVRYNTDNKVEELAIARITVGK